jgi:hypothetical protein
MEVPEIANRPAILGTTAIAASWYARSSEIAEQRAHARTVSRELGAPGWPVYAADAEPAASAETSIRTVTP